MSTLRISTNSCDAYIFHFLILIFFSRITLNRVIEADVSAAVVLISMGALLGRTTPIQLLFMALIEVVVYAANEYFQLELLKVGFHRSLNWCVHMYHHASSALHQIIIALLLLQQCTHSSH